MELGLEGKVALVTGASKGIGKAIGAALAAEGCRVILSARGKEDLEAAVEEIRAAGGVAHAIAADMSDAEEIEKLAGETISRVGTVDVLVNNAGGIGSSSPFEELSDEDWLGALELNLLSAVRLIRAVLPRMRQQGWGRIINVASESGIQPDPSCRTTTPRRPP